MSDLKPIDLRNLNEKKKNFCTPGHPEYRLELQGVFGDKRIEALPARVATPCEVEIRGKNSNYIILGRDRPGRRDQGYAGTGDTHASMIDIVVGMQAYDAADDKFVDPDFQKDAARIYISQKTDIDKNFRLNGKSAEATAAIGMYADNIRIASRENIKIVSGVGKKNSRGISLDSSKFGVEVIANNDAAGLQPMVKGTNLELALKKLISHIHDIYAVIERLLNEQDRLNKAITDHQHFTPFFGKASGPSPTCQLYGLQTIWHHFTYTKFDIRMARTNLQNFENNHLKSGGKGYINSYYNRVN